MSYLCIIFVVVFSSTTFVWADTKIIATGKFKDPAHSVLYDNLAEIQQTILDDELLRANAISIAELEGAIQTLNKYRNGRDIYIDPRFRGLDTESMLRKARRELMGAYDFFNVSPGDIK